MVGICNDHKGFSNRLCNCNTLFRGVYDYHLIERIRVCFVVVQLNSACL